MRIRQRPEDRIRARFVWALGLAMAGVVVAYRAPLGGFEIIVGILLVLVGFSCLD